MEKDIRRYLSRYTSVYNSKDNNIEKSQILRCQRQVEEVLARYEDDPDIVMSGQLSDYELGLVYFFGIGDVRNDDEGLYYLKLAADNEADEHMADAMNMYAYANYHLALTNGDQDSIQVQRYKYMALKFFEKAAELGQLEAIFNLGVSYVEGRIAVADEVRGLELINRAKDLGHPQAAVYLKEYEIKKNPLTAIGREDERDRVYESIVARLKGELDSIPKDFSMVGLFNDIYLEDGYEWVKKSPALGWMASRDDGESYLITEAELEDIYVLLTKDR